MGYMINSLLEYFYKLKCSLCMYTYHNVLHDTGVTKPAECNLLDLLIHFVVATV